MPESAAGEYIRFALGGGKADRSQRLFDRFGDQNGNDAVGSALVILVRWVGFNRERPQTLSLSRVADLANPHPIDISFVADFNMRICLQIVIPQRMLGCAALRGDE